MVKTALDGVYELFSGRLFKDLEAGPRRVFLIKPLNEWEEKDLIQYGCNFIALDLIDDKKFYLKFSAESLNSLQPIEPKDLTSDEAQVLATYEQAKTHLQQHAQSQPKCTDLPRIPSRLEAAAQMRVLGMRNTGQGP